LRGDLEGGIAQEVRHRNLESSSDPIDGVERRRLELLTFVPPEHPVGYANALAELDLG